MEKAIADLGNSDFRTREDAETRLAEIGFRDSAVRATESSNQKSQSGTSSILKALEAKHGGEGKGEVRDYDVVETPEFTMKGPALISNR